MIYQHHTPIYTLLLELVLAVDNMKPNQSEIIRWSGNPKALFVCPTDQNSVGCKNPYSHDLINIRIKSGGGRPKNKVWQVLNV